MIKKLAKEKELQQFFFMNSRNIHNSHLNKILKNRYKDKYRDKYLDNIYNNEMNINDINKNVKNKKVDYLRLFIQDEEEQTGEDFLLGPDIFDNMRRRRDEIKKEKLYREKQDSSTEERDRDRDRNKYMYEESEKQQLSESKYKQAIRIYSLLKMNDKTSVFDEDVFMNMDSKINHDIYQFSQNHVLNIEQPNDAITIDKFQKNSTKDESKQIEERTETKNEDGDIHIKEKDTAIMNENVTTDENVFDITQMNLPIFNPNSFCLAMECLTNHICDDLIFLFEDFIDKSKMPKADENDRLRKMVNLIENFFCLEKNEKDADRWIDEVYQKIKPFLPNQLKYVSNTYLKKWLKGHIHRVLQCQQIKNENLYHKKYYNLGTDFEYDNLINKNNYIDVKTEYSVDKCTYYIKKIWEFLFQNKLSVDIEEQLNLLFLNLKKIGLDNWLQMDIEDFEKYLLQSKSTDYLNIKESDKYASYLMLICASRNMTDFFFFEELSPFHLFNEKKQNIYANANTIEEKIQKLKENKHLPDEQIKKMIYTDTNSSVTIFKKQGSIGQDPETESNYEGVDIDLFIEKEKSYNQNRSIITYSYDDKTDTYKYKYKQIPNTIFDFTTSKYIREKETIDPMLKLNEMRSSILEVKRMMSMTKDGRVYYIRVVIVIGNGKGVYGYGVGFGKNIKEARNSALLNSISNIDFLDYNYKNCVLNFPVIGQEYSAHVKIIPRPLGKGLKMNRKYLPLGYILGLDNVKISFSGSSTAWITRIKALKRALNKITSIKTLCNMTGRKYVCHFAPHYYTSHWPDYWFKSILREYENKIQKIKKKRFMVYKKNFRSNISKIPEEVKPDFTPYTWKSPIQKFAESAKLKKYIDTNIYHTDVF